MAYVENYNEFSGPFQWTATADEILGKLVRLRLRADLAVTGH